MGQINISVVEKAILKAEKKVLEGKPVEKKQLEDCLSWLQENPRGKHQTTINKIEALLINGASKKNQRSIFDVTSLSTFFNIFRSYQEAGRSGVVTKSGESSALIPGEAPLFNRIISEHRSMEKRINVNNLGCTSLFIFPSTSKSGFFALNLDRGLDSHQRPSNYERIYFEVPPDSDFEDLKEIIQTLFGRYCNTLPHTVEATTQELWLGAIENGRTYSYNDFSDYHSNLSSALQHFATLPPHWVERSTILEYNPEITPTNPFLMPMSSPSNLSKLVNFQKRFPTLSSYPIKEAKSILAKVEWFKSSSEDQDNSTLIAEYKRNQVEEALAKYIASSSKDYDRKKVITFYHIETLEQRLSASTMIKLKNMHSLYMIHDYWKNYTKQTLISILRNRRDESCGREAFFHLNNIIPLQTNQVISQISGLKCWDKTAQSKISEVHDTINWSEKQKTMRTNSTNLKSKIASSKKSSNDLGIKVRELGIYLEGKGQLAREMKNAEKRKEIISRKKKQLQAAMKDLKQPMQKERELQKLNTEIDFAKIYKRYKPRKFALRKNKLESFRQGTGTRVHLMNAMLDKYDKLSVDLTKINADIEKVREREKTILDSKYMSMPLLECKELSRSLILKIFKIKEEIKMMEQEMRSIMSDLYKHQRLKP